MPQTALRIPTREDLYASARKRFLRGERMDIQGLAAELGISRATAYRWVGNADELVGVIVADLAEETFRRSSAEAKGRGAARVVDVMRRGMTYVVTSKPFRCFLERDPQRGLRIAASKEGPSQARMIALHEQLLEEEIARGALALPVDTRTMAYALVRTAESFMYADIVAGEQPDIDAAVEILRLLLADRRSR